MPAATVNVIIRRTEWRPTDDDVERRERDLGAPAARVAVSVAHPGAGGAAGPGPPVRDGGGAAGRQRARSAEGRDPGLAALPARRAGLVRHHGAGRARWPG